MPSPIKTSTIYCRVPRDAHEEAVRRAADHGSTLTALVCQALDEYLILHFGWEPGPRPGLPQ